MARIFVAANSDFIDFGNNVNIGANDACWAVWVNHTTLTLIRMLQKRGSGSFSTQSGWQISQNLGVGWLNTGLSDGSGNYSRFSTTDYNVNDGSWHLVIVTWDNSAGTLSLYIDDVFRETGTNTGVPAGKNFDTTRNLTYGCAWNDVSTQSQFYDGTGGPFAVWIGHLLTAEERTSLYRRWQPHKIAPANLEISCRMDGNDASNEPDFSGNGVNGTVNGTLAKANNPPISLMTPIHKASYLDIALIASTFKPRVITY